MKTVSVFCQKGGSGKTSISTNLAAMAAERGMTVQILDLDPQGSSLEWGDLRTKNMDLFGLAPVGISSAAHSRLPIILETARNAGVDLVIIDLPPKAADALPAAADVSDLCLVPVVPEIFDLKTLPTALRMCKAVGKDPVAVINRAHHAGGEVADARRTLQALEVEVCPPILYQRKPIAQAQADGLSAEEYHAILKGEGRARTWHKNSADEMVQLLIWVLARINMPVVRQQQAV